jgi:hypothetical protein
MCVLIVSRLAFRTHRTIGGCGVFLHRLLETIRRESAIASKPGAADVLWTISSRS